MLTGRQRVIPIAAIIVAVLGVAAIMLSPITPWMRGVAMCGVVSFVAGSGVLVLWLLTRWWGSPRRRRSAPGLVSNRGNNSVGRRDGADLP
jgi:hypothetical protein